MVRAEPHGIRANYKAFAARGASKSARQAIAEVPWPLLMRPAQAKVPARVAPQLAQGPNLLPLKLPGGLLARAGGEAGLADAKMRLPCEDDQVFRARHGRQF